MRTGDARASERMCEALLHHDDDEHICNVVSCTYHKNLTFLKERMYACVYVH